MKNMKKTKAVSLLLSLSLLASLAIPGTLALPVRAEGEQENNGMVISKTAEANGDGTYTIKLEAYATGDKIITETKKDIPTDIILVLDQSGSMADPMSSEEAYSAYENRSNSYLRGERFNGGGDNLYYPVDGGYVEVQVDRTNVNSYEPFDTDTSNRTYYDSGNRNALYIQDANGNYQRVTVERTSEWQSSYRYTYFVDGKQIVQSDGRNSVPDFGTYAPIYRAGEVYQYTYYYQLSGQERVNIETSLGENTVPNETYYQYGTVNTSRLEALESAVTAFANSIAEKAAGADKDLGTDDDVNHRVAVVGFASKDGYGNNTELLSIRGQNSGSVGVEYDSITSQNLVDVLQDMDTTVGQGMVRSAIGALAAAGATQADLGMDMANRILNANPVAENEKRARVVVFFTDGSPTSYSGFEDSVAVAAITNANNIKDPDAVNYGLEAWQNAYVDISVVIKNAKGNVVNADLTELREDTTYTVEVQVSPKETALSTSDGDAAAAKSGTDEANINVFKPELTYQDSEVYYGADVPTDFTGNLTDTKWKHNDTEADTAAMGAAPDLTIDYTVDETKVDNGKINTKQDVGVDALVQIGETDVTTDATFLHTACPGTDCNWDITEPDGTPAFLLHVQTCQLTISKTGGADHEPYVFTVKKDGVKYSEITIVGNNSETIYELPIGTYTIEEDTGWSWRYNANNGGNAVLTAEKPTGNITCTNTKTEEYWLDGFSDVVKNIFGNKK